MYRTLLNLPSARKVNGGHGPPYLRIVKKNQTANAKGNYKKG